MKHPIFLSSSDIINLEYEVVSQDLRVYLTRLIDRNDEFRRFGMINRNAIINRSRSLAGLPVYVLEGDEYEPCEYAWHNGEFELALRRNDTAHFAELLCEIVDRGWLSEDEVNAAFIRENSSLRIDESSGEVVVRVLSLEDIVDDSPDEDEHLNIRVLVDRMQSSLNSGDYSSVLHSSASVFETLAKDIIGAPTIQDKSLGGFLEMYKKRTNLPPDMQEKIIEVYNSRNSLPLAGHGSTSSPSFSEEEAIILCELTKAFVKIEYGIERTAIKAN
ncbi:hypothetical protein [Chromohalobacter nigrandesensis]|uniref:hypothetical protein n=1 Tax=Chromohalobacter nigrandesensis TaxID=119863 RepID=UPI001FF2C7C5|nr:hypothetical protein [Chromohalobacter nigrandesensis]MCK0746823.1 hypothetical protein [Chromohalobacter nigrandesensis]